MSQIITLFRKYNNPKIAVDYLKARDLAKEEMVNKGGWGSLTPEEKDYIIEFFLEDPNFDTSTNNTMKVGHLIGVYGMELAEAAQYLADRYPVHHVKEREACLKRAQCEDIMKVLQKYLEIVDMADFIETTKTLYDGFKDEGIRGSGEGSHGEGLFDFIESKAGTSYENAGLEAQGYVLKNGGTYPNLVSEMMNILRDGNYTK